MAASQLKTPFLCYNQLVGYCATCCCLSVFLVKNGALMARHANPLKSISIFLVKFYCYCVSPLLGENCRFYPSCSVYALKSLDRHGFFRGWWLIIIRLLCCHPWHQGGYDPVPYCEENHHSVEPDNPTHQPESLADKSWTCKERS